MENAEYRPQVSGLLFFIILLLLPGCGDAGEATIAVKNIHLWPFPPDGRRIPAPRSVTVSGSGEVVVLDTGGRVLVYDGEGTLKRQWRMPESEIGQPEGACVLKDGRIAVADTHYHRVVFFHADGRIAGQLGKYGKGPGEFIYPVTLTQDEDENIYVAEYGSNDRVQKFARDGSFLLSFGSFGTGPGEFQRPSGIVWHDGRVFVADAINNRIQVFSDSGKFIGILGSEQKPLTLHFPYDIALGPEGALYVVEYGAGRISKVSLQGSLLGRYGNSGTGLGQFRTPWGIGVDSKARVLVADTGNRRIVELTQ